MQYKEPERMNLPALRSNPFDIRPLNRKEMELLVGRNELFQALANNIRFTSPRVVAIVGEKGSGRSSLIQSVAATTEHIHTVFWPEKDEVTTILHQLYCDLMKDFETPPVHSVLIDRLEEELAGNSGNLPLIIFDHPHLPGPELAEVLTKLMPVLTRVRALTLISLTPGQKAGFSEELLSEMDVTPPLEPLTREEIAGLISKRVHKASRSSWTAPPVLLDMVMEESGGHVSRAMRFLRDFVDYTRGMPLADGRIIDMKVMISTNPPTEVADSTFQRVAEVTPSTSEVDVEVRDTTEEPEPITESHSEKEGSEEGEEVTLFPSLSEAADMWSGYEKGEELEDEGELQFDSDTEMEILDAEQQSFDDEETHLDESLSGPMEEEPVEQEEVISTDSPPSWKQEFSDAQGGAEMLDMQPETAPASGGGKLGGLRSRVRATNIALSADQKGTPAPSTGPMEAKPNDIHRDPNQLQQVETNDSNIVLWVQDGVDSPMPKRITQSGHTQPLVEGGGVDMPSSSPDYAAPLDERVTDETNPAEVLAALSSMRRVASPVEPTVTLDINALMNLNAGEMTILEQVIEREVSPSDEFLQQELTVGRPRLSQIFNRLLKFGILTVRKQGRSRLFRISAPAKDHLTNLGSGGD